MDTNFESGSGYMPELEGVLVMKGGGEFSPPPNVPITEFLVPPLAEQPSSRNPYFSIPNPSGVGLNQFQLDETMAPIFGLNAPFWETAIGQFSNGRYFYASHSFVKHWKSVFTPYIRYS